MWIYYLCNILKSRRWPQFIVNWSISLSFLLHFVVPLEWTYAVAALDPLCFSIHVWFLCMSSHWYDLFIVDLFLLKSRGDSIECHYGERCVLRSRSHQDQSSQGQLEFLSLWLADKIMLVQVQFTLGPRPMPSSMDLKVQLEDLHGQSRWNYPHL